MQSVTFISIKQDLDIITKNTYVNFTNVYITKQSCIKSRLWRKEGRNENIKNYPFINILRIAYFGCS